MHDYKIGGHIQNYALLWIRVYKVIQMSSTTYSSNIFSSSINKVRNTISPEISALTQSYLEITHS